MRESLLLRRRKTEIIESEPKWQMIKHQSVTEGRCREHDDNNQIFVPNERVMDAHFGSSQKLTSLLETSRTPCGQVSNYKYSDK